MINVLILGGTGIISSEVCQCLSKKSDIRVTAITRGSEWRRKLLPDGINRVSVDVRDSQGLCDVPGNYDSIIDFISFTPKHLLSKLRAFQGRFIQYIFVSSVAAYSENILNHQMVDDNSPIGNTDNEYGFEKAISELFLKEYLRTGNGNYTIVRPGFVYGNLCFPHPLTEGYTQRSMILLERIKNGQAIPVFWDESHQYRGVNAKDLATAICSLIGNKIAYGKSIHICGDDTIGWNSLLMIAAVFLGVDLKSRFVTMQRLENVAPDWKRDVLQGMTDINIENIGIKKIVKDWSCKIDYRSGMKGLIQFYEDNRNKIYNYEEFLRCREDVNAIFDRMCRNEGI